jgi:hypothetical protein
MNYGTEKWIIEYAKGEPSKLALTKTGWKVNIPPYPGAISFIRTVKQFDIGKKEVTFSATFNLTPDCAIDYKTEESNVCNVPASIRPILIRSMYGQFNRWWPLDKITIAPGTFSIKGPLQPSDWVSVYGKKGDTDKKTVEFFNKCKQEPIYLGVAIGGGCFYGHGVRTLSGSGSIELTKFSIA